MTIEELQDELKDLQAQIDHKQYEQYYELQPLREKRDNVLILLNALQAGEALNLLASYGLGLPHIDEMRKLHTALELVLHQHDTENQEPF